jgi:hypothetical protein
MPPKKKGTLKLKKGTGDHANVELQRAQDEVALLQRQLVLRSHELLEAREYGKMWREKCETFDGAFEKQKEHMLDIASDMERQSAVR